MTDKATPGDAQANDGLGPLPAYVYGRECGENEKVWTEEAVRMYARAAVAAERERSQAELKQLRAVALEHTPHVYAGECPDEIDRTLRDSNCPACRLLGLPKQEDINMDSDGRWQ